MEHALNLMVIAEGIETLETANLLKSLDCDQAQGYYYAKPLAKDDFIQLLNEKEACYSLDHLRQISAK